jgi:hypothetical protein
MTRFGPPSSGRVRRVATAALVCVAAVLGLGGTALAAGPTVETLPTDPTLLSDSYALLSGVVNPKGFNTVYRFEWGRTTAYGHTTPVTPAGNGKADVPVDVSLDALKPNTTYHYRLVASPVKANGDFAYLGDVVGADQTFKTAKRLGVTFGRSAKVAKGKAKVRLRAVGPVGERAAGTFTLKLKVGKKLKKVGAARYSIATGKSKTLKVKLSKLARKALARATAHKLKVTAVAKTRGVKKPATHKLVLKA